MKNQQNRNITTIVADFDAAPDAIRAIHQCFPGEWMYGITVQSLIGNAYRQPPAAPPRPPLHERSAGKETSVGSFPLESDRRR